MFFFCHYCLSYDRRLFLSSWEQPFSLFAPRLCSTTPITPPHVFPKFSHTHSSPISPHTPTFFFTINKMSKRKENPLLHRCCA
jgi:hypothetical protein